MNFMGRRTRVSVQIFGFALAIAAGLALLLAPASLVAEESGSQLLVRQLRGESLSHSLIGTDPVRKLAVYLPPGYERSAQRYPVIYYLPNPLAKFDEDFYRGQAREVLDRAMAAAEIGKVIFVAVDMATPLGCSWYVN